MYEYNETSESRGFYYEKSDACGCSEKGTVIHTVSTCEIIADKNGITLKRITVTEKIHWELFMDGELVNKFYNEKTAKAMWKDFSC